MSFLGATPTKGGEARHAVVDGLVTVLNVISISVGVVVVSLTVVGLPLALSAGWSVIYHWRRGGEGRVLRGFVLALRDRSLRRTLLVSPGVIAAALGAAEVWYFVHYGGPVAAVCLAVGFVTFVVGAGATAYLLLLAALGNDAGVWEIWRCAVALVARTSVGALPLLALEAATGVVVGYLDPAMLVVVVPTVVLWCWMRTGIWGARRAGLAL